MAVKRVTVTMLRTVLGETNTQWAAGSQQSASEDFAEYLVGMNAATREVALSPAVIVEGSYSVGSSQLANLARLGQLDEGALYVVPNGTRYWATSTSSYSRDFNPFLTVNKLLTAASLAKGNNSYELAPWNGPVAGTNYGPWAATTSYPSGSVVSKGGYMYLMHSGTGGALTAGTSGATGPIGTVAAQTDGTCVWLFLGPLSTTTTTFTLSGVTITGTAGQFACTGSSAPLQIGMVLTISGTLGGTGSITGYASPTSYLILATDGASIMTLGTLAGAAIVTTAGTPTGLTYTVNASSLPGAPTAVFIAATTASLTALGLTKVTADLGATANLTNTLKQINFGGLVGPDPGFAPDLAFLGPPSGAAGSAAATNAAHPYFEFETDADVVSIAANQAFSPATNFINIELNGRFLYPGNYWFKSGNVGDGSSTFPTMIVDMRALPLGTFKTVRVYGKILRPLLSTIRCKPQYSVRAPTYPHAVRLAIEGDSLVDGGNCVPSYAGQNVNVNLARRLGLAGVYCNGVGGTGYNAAGASRTTYAQRLANIVSYAPDVLAVLTCHNGTTATQNVIDYVTAARAALPNALILVFGTPLLQGESSTSGAVFNNEVAVMAASVSFAADPMIRFIPVLTATVPWFTDTGTGNAFSPTGGGIGDRIFYVGGSLTDAHPLWTGVDYYAARCALEIERVCRSIVG
jgi:hypothetical protein